MGGLCAVRWRCHLGVLDLAVLAWLQQRDCLSQLQDKGLFVGIAAVIAVSLLIRAMVRAQTPMSAYGLCLIVAGAIGNLSDRVFRGKGWLHGRVVDFIDFQWFPSFNIADSAITIGAVLLIASLWFEYRSQVPGDKQ